MTYNEFIDNIRTSRGQWNIPRSDYFEVHHILPVCIGGLPSHEDCTLSSIKYSQHPNLIWLYPEEHYTAHKLLYEENPENYGLFAAWVGTTCNGQYSVDDYATLKRYKHDLPDHILAKQPKQDFHYKKLKQPQRKTNRDVSKYVAYQERKRAAGICETRGENNGMFGKGHLVAGGRNGHASIRYFYKDKVFECRKELINYLNDNNIKITDSAIRAIVHKTGTLRVYNMYKEVFDNLTWEYKE